MSKFSNVIRKQIERYVVDTIAKDRTTVHVISYSGTDKLYDIVERYIDTNTMSISNINEVKNSLYSKRSGNTINIFSTDYNKIQALLAKLKTQSNFRREAGKDYDLDRYTTHDVLANIQRKVPNSVVSKLKSTNYFVKYKATSDTYVGPRTARSKIVLDVVDANLDTKGLSKFFNAHIFSKGNVLIEKISTNLGHIFKGRKAKVYKKKLTTSDTVKRKGTDKKVKAHNPIKAKDIKGRFISTIRLMELLQPLTTQYIKRNMDTAAYFKTLNGTFTKTSKIENITQISNRLFIQYDYLSNYNDFRSGKRLHRSGREPETVIETSIRLAAKKVVSDKFELVLQRKPRI